jgi:predicted AlkP superfamily phosphohydrolase/phosphomutase
MLTLFRRIRKGLLDGGNTGRYLVYAVGEIMLVVIGILIAVQINSFYNNKANESRITKLLNRLVEEAKLNVERLDLLEYNMNVKFTNDFQHATINLAENEIIVDSILKIIYRGITIHDLDFLVKGTYVNRSSFNLHSSVYEEMISTGSLYNLGSENLINEIHKYYKLIDREDYYHKLNVQEFLAELSACKYGWNSFAEIYAIDKTSSIQDNKWLFDRTSTHYVNYRIFLKTGLKTIKRSRVRIRDLREASEALVIMIDQNLLE